VFSLRFVDLKVVHPVHHADTIKMERITIMAILFHLLTSARPLHIIPDRHG
jgi:hypothetical protein